MRKAAFLALERNFLCFEKSSSIVGLLDGSFYKQALTKSLNDESHFSVFESVGGAPFKIVISTFMAGRLE